MELKNPSKLVSRRRLRGIALKMLFMYYFFQKNFPFHEENTTNDFEKNLNDIIQTDYNQISLSSPDKDFLAYIFNGVLKNQTSINKVISANLNKITIEELYIIDLIVLQIAVFEILSNKTPIEVITNEAGVLANKFSKKTSRRFIY